MPRFRSPKATPSRVVSLVVALFLTTVGLTALSPAASASDGLVDVTSLPFNATARAYDASGAGGPGTSALNAAVSSSCNSGNALYAPQWFSLPHATGTISAWVQASYQPRGIIVEPSGYAIVDVSAGTVLSCNGSISGAAASGAHALVAYFVNDYSSCATDWNWVCDTRLDVNIYASVSTPGAENTDWSHARTVAALPYTDHVDLRGTNGSFAGVDGCFVGGSTLVAAIGTGAWWRWTPSAAGAWPTIDVHSNTPGYNPSVVVAEQTASGPEFNFVLQEDGVNTRCERPAVVPGKTYLIAVVQTYDSYYESPLVKAGDFSLTIAGPAAPTAPQAVAASADGATSTGSLSWAQPGSDGGSPVTGYVVTRHSPNARGADVSQTLPASARSFDFPSLASGETYELSVRAVNAAGTGTPAAVPVTVVSPLPSAPTVTATPGAGRVAVAWKTPDTAGASPIIAYRIGRYVGAATSPEAISTVPASAHLIVMTRLTNGVGYSFKVWAVNSNGLGQPSARTPVVTPVSVPDAATAVNAVADGVARTATVTWAAPASDGGSPITGYVVSRDGVDRFGSSLDWSTTVPAAATSYTFPNLRDWETYHLTVRPLNALGVGTAASVPVTIAAPVPSAPVSVTAVAGYRSARISWGQPLQSGTSAVAYYRVRRFVGNALVPQAVKTVPATAHSVVMGRLRPGVTYTFDVVAVNSSGTSPLSTRASAVPLTLRRWLADVICAGQLGHSAHLCE